MNKQSTPITKNVMLVEINWPKSSKIKTIKNWPTCFVYTFL
jgi:hypothetical protein